LKDFNNFNGRARSLFPSTVTNASTELSKKSKLLDPLAVRESVISNFDEKVGLTSNNVINK